jgi:hypothetical protein
MILLRIANALRRPDWTAALIGLAASDRYTQRIERQSVLLMLDQLRAGLIADAGTLQQAIQRRARVFDLHEGLLATLELLQAAVARGFRAAWVIDSDPYFGAWREDPEFVALTTEIRRLNDIERAQLAEMDLQP